jgi:hypothetical protein
MSNKIATCISLAAPHYNKHIIAIPQALTLLKHYNGTQHTQYVTQSLVEQKKKTQQNKGDKVM